MMQTRQICIQLATIKLFSSACYLKFDNEGEIYEEFDYPNEDRVKDFWTNLRGQSPNPSLVSRCASFFVRDGTCHIHT